MRIRLVNPHAQSKDSYTSARASAVAGGSPSIGGSMSDRGNSERDATVESHPSKNEGWGALQP